MRAARLVSHSRAASWGNATERAIPSRARAAVSVDAACVRTDRPARLGHRRCARILAPLRAAGRVGDECTNRDADRRNQIAEVPCVPSHRAEARHRAGHAPGHNDVITTEIFGVPTASATPSIRAALIAVKPACAGVLDNCRACPSLYRTARRRRNGGARSLREHWSEQ